MQTQCRRSADTLQTRRNTKTQRDNLSSSRLCCLPALFLTSLGPIHNKHETKTTQPTQTNDAKPHHNASTDTIPKAMGPCFAPRAGEYSVLAKGFFKDFLRLHQTPGKARRRRRPGGLVQSKKVRENGPAKLEDSSNGGGPMAFGIVSVDALWCGFASLVCVGCVVFVSCLL